MRLIEISSLENGAHRNLTTMATTIPDGWAIIPDDMETPNFPFGDIEVAKMTEEVDGVVIEGAHMVVTKWTAGTIPEPEPEPEPEPTVDERVAALEAQLAETDEVAIDFYEASLKQEAINAEQDEAIIEIYEMMEGTTNG